MFGKTSRLNPLAARKELLIAESELNRAQLVRQWQTLADEARALADQARTVHSMASAAASLVAGLASLRHKKSAPVPEKTSWLRTLLKSAGHISTIWSAVRPMTSARDRS